MRTLALFVVSLAVAATPAAAAPTRVFTGEVLTGPVVSGDRAIVGTPNAAGDLELRSIGASGDQRSLGTFGPIPAPEDPSDADDGFYNYLSVLVSASATHMAATEGRFSGWRDVPNTASSVLRAGPIGAAPTVTETSCAPSPSQTFAVDGSRLAEIAPANCSQGTYELRVADLANGSTIASNPYSGSRPYSVDFAGGYVAVANTSAQTNVYDAATGAAVTSVAGSGFVAVAPDGAVARVATNYTTGCDTSLDWIPLGATAATRLDSCPVDERPSLDAGRVFYIRNDRKTQSIRAIDAGGASTTYVTAPDGVISGLDVAGGRAAYRVAGCTPARGSVWLGDLSGPPTTVTLSCPAKWSARKHLAASDDGYFRARIACPNGCTGAMYAERYVGGEWVPAAAPVADDFDFKYSTDGPTAVVKFRVEGNLRDRFARRRRAWHMRLHADVAHGKRVVRSVTVG